MSLGGTICVIEGNLYVEIEIEIESDDICVEDLD